MTLLAASYANWATVINPDAKTSGLMAATNAAAATAMKTNTLTVRRIRPAVRRATGATTAWAPTAGRCVFVMIPLSPKGLYHARHVVRAMFWSLRVTGSWYFTAMAK